MITKIKLKAPVKISTKVNSNVNTLKIFITEIDYEIFNLNLFKFLLINFSISTK